MCDLINQLLSWLGGANIGVEILLSLEETFMVKWIGYCNPLILESRDDILVFKISSFVWYFPIESCNYWF